MNQSFIGLFSFLILIACDSTDKSGTEDSPASSSTAQRPEPANTLVASLEEAHKVDAFLEKDNIAFDITFFFRGKKRLEGSLYSTTNSSKVRLDKADGPSVVFDGDRVMLMPADAKYSGARFDIFTWHYFFMAPFKLSDPGTQWEMLNKASLTSGDTVSMERGKLSFEAGVGDAPKDWYIVYQDPEDGLVEAMAYIVTLNKSVEKAEEEPHAISYANYQLVEGIPIATEWKVWMWTEEKGILDEIGYATISNIRFLEETEDIFNIDEDNASPVNL